MDEIIDMQQTFVEKISLNLSGLPQIGEVIDEKYKIVREIARGGMGVVYEATDLMFNRKVAFKMIQFQASSNIAIKRFQREMKACSQLSHPNIIKMYNGGLYKKSPYMVMEYIQGISISEYVKKYDSAYGTSNKRDYNLCVKLILQVVHALEYIHSQKIYHRDIKPSNILVCDDGRVVLIDFGIVKFQQEQSFTLTKTHDIIGTYNYMPPEQINGKKVDAQSDLYSLGIVLYELLTEQLLFHGSMMYILQQVLTMQPTLPTSIKSDIPKELEKIVMHAIEKEKKYRYKNATIFANALENYLKNKQEQPEQQIIHNNKKLCLLWNKKNIIACCIILFIAGIATIAINLTNTTNNEQQSNQDISNVPDKNNIIAINNEQQSNQDKTSKNSNNQLNNKQTVDKQQTKQDNKNNEPKTIHQQQTKQDNKNNKPEIIHKQQDNKNILTSNKKNTENNNKQSKKLIEEHKQEPNKNNINDNKNLAQNKKSEKKNKHSNKPVTNNKKKADELLKSANTYYNGNGKEQDFKKARELYENAFKLYKIEKISIDAQAQFNLATMYEKGQGGEKSLTQARKWYENATNQGHAGAKSNLADMYYNGQGGEKDFKKAFELYQSAFAIYQKDNVPINPESQYNLANMYFYGKGVEKNLQEARKWYENATNQGHAGAECSLANMYYYGQGGEKDLSKARQLYENAFAIYKKEDVLIDAQSQFNLATIYETGKDKKKKLAEAYKLYECAANQGHKEAQLKLADLYYYGHGVKKDLKQARQWYEKIANQGSKEAQLRLADMYYYGHGGEKNLKQAHKWYEKALLSYQKEKKSIPIQSQFNLATIYENEDNLYNASKLYEQVANKGHKEAQLRLANMYYYGHGVKKNLIEAGKWYEKAFVSYHKAKVSIDPQAQFNLATMYDKGQYGKRNAFKAKKLYEQVAKQGHKEAKLKIAKKKK